MRDRLLLADRFRAKRKQRDLTQVELAQKAGVSVSFVKYVEAGRTQPSDPYMKAFAEALNCTVEELSIPKVAA